MRLALREMRRRPGRFMSATVILTLVSLLIVYLGGLIDGTVRGGTGAFDAQPGDLYVYSTGSQSAMPDSRITAEVRNRVEAVPGVTAVSGLGVSQLGARLPGRGPRDLIDVAIVGYQRASAKVPAPPTGANAYADRALRAEGIAKGMTIAVGPTRSQLTVIGFVDNTAFDGQGTLWTSLDTWRTIQRTNRPAKAPGAGDVQILVVNGSSARSTLAGAIDAATAGATETVTRAGAIAGLPGVEGTKAVFSAVIGFTTFIGAVVIALLFALLVVERIALYGVLKALGARSSSLFASLTVQATVIAIIASLAGTGLGAALGAVLTSGVSAYHLTPARAVSSAALVIIASLIGAAITLRRVLRIDPASVIGSTT